MMTAVDRASTLLKTRYSSLAYWMVGLALFQAAERVAGGSSDVQRARSHRQAAEAMVAELRGAEEGEESGGGLTGAVSARSGMRMTVICCCSVGSWQYALVETSTNMMQLRIFTCQALRLVINTVTCQ